MLLQVNNCHSTHNQLTANMSAKLTGHQMAALRVNAQSKPGNNTRGLKIT